MLLASIPPEDMSPDEWDNLIEDKFQDAQRLGHPFGACQLAAHGMVEGLTECFELLRSSMNDCKPSVQMLAMLYLNMPWPHNSFRTPNITLAVCLQATLDVWVEFCAQNRYVCAKQVDLPLVEMVCLGSQHTAEPGDENVKVRALEWLAQQPPAEVEYLLDRHDVMHRVLTLVHTLPQPIAEEVAYYLATLG